MFLENSYVHSNTTVHRLNPIIKFLIFLPIVFLLFMRISFLVQSLLFLFMCLVIWKSDSLDICKRIVSMYLVLFLFLYTVNFFFLKSPGFWYGSRLGELRDLFGTHDVRPSHNDSKLMHGWYVGGEILAKKDKNLWFGTREEARCLEGHLKIISENCSSYDASKYASDFENIDNHTNWRIFPIPHQGEVKYAAFSPTWYTISAYQITNAFSLANKIILIILLSAIFTRTISLGLFSYALEDILKPLKLLKLPNRIMALAIAIAIRFVPSLISESFRIIRAQASRGIDYKNGRFKDKASALLSLFVPLFVISFMKAGELSEAMIARGYDNYHPRNGFRVCHLRPWELMVLFFSMSFITFLYYFFSHSWCLGLAMDLEVLTLLAR